MLNTLIINTPTAAAAAARRYTDAASCFFFLFFFVELQSSSRAPRGGARRANPAKVITAESVDLGTDEVFVFFWAEAFKKNAPNQFPGHILSVVSPCLVLFVS